MRFFFFWRNWMHEQLSIKALPWFLKIIAAVIGAIFALTLSGDIDTDGRIKINVSVIVKLVFSVAISLYFLNGVCRHELNGLVGNSFLSFLNGVCRHELKRKKAAFKRHFLNGVCRHER